MPSLLRKFWESREHKGLPVAVDDIVGGIGTNVISLLPCVVIGAERLDRRSIYDFRNFFRARIQIDFRHYKKYCVDSGVSMRSNQCRLGNVAAL
ncbi:predicted protein [Plenodomus lingam JN3]|uniref:Predicted protein n=1 Tax=Leptosphaeria maculans (strain JN3 / isolate v23.1.3 / race Av1-4-5-6-7-8) TaxID=985895 RepID=E5A3N3_LEPMJ|nr:predicted protein [Plenodomus lingam JN3]CBX98246.1 predicted protein [Plenodomus lingam JN3]